MVHIPAKEKKERGIQTIVLCWLELDNYLLNTVFPNLFFLVSMQIARYILYGTSINVVLYSCLYWTLLIISHFLNHGIKGAREEERRASVSVNCGAARDGLMSTTMTYHHSSVVNKCSFSVEFWHVRMLIAYCFVTAIGFIRGSLCWSVSPSLLPL